jgi:YVTN family beta-propeller protein
VEGNSVDALAVDPSRGELFIASGPAQTVTVVDESTDLVVATIPIGNAGPP